MAQKKTDISLDTLLGIVKDEKNRALIKQFADLTEEIVRIATKDQSALNIICSVILPYLNNALNQQRIQCHYKEIDDRHDHLPTDQGSFVYLLFDRATKLLKIGTTGNIRSRIRTLRSSSPSGKNIILLAYCAGNASEEKHFHNRFHHLRLHGEWFKPHTDITDFFKSWTAEKNGRFNESYIEKYAKHFNQ